jgi:hypothetical protein
VLLRNTNTPSKAFVFDDMCRTEGAMFILWCCKQAPVALVADPRRVALRALALETGDDCDACSSAAIVAALTIPVSDPTDLVDAKARAQTLDDWSEP